MSESDANPARASREQSLETLKHRTAWLTLASVVFGILGAGFGFWGKSQAAQASSDAAAMEGRLEELRELIAQTIEAQKGLESSLVASDQAVKRLQGQSFELTAEVTRRLDTERTAALKTQAEVTEAALTRLRQEVADKMALLRERADEAEAAANRASAAAAFARAAVRDIPVSSSRGGTEAPAPAVPAPVPTPAPAAGVRPGQRNHPEQALCKVTIGGSGNSVVLIAQAYAYQPMNGHSALGDKTEYRFAVSPGCDVVITISGSNNVLFVPNALRADVAVEDSGKDNTVKYFDE